MNQSTLEKVFQPVVHWVKIVVRSHENRQTVVKSLIWKDMSFAVRTKWDWYFKYLASLEQVNSPRAIVELSWGSEPATGKSLIEIKTDRLRSRKQQITKISNAIRNHEESMSKLLFWEKDKDEQYQKALTKLHRAQMEFTELESEIKELKKITQS